MGGLVELGMILMKTFNSDELKKLLRDAEQQEEDSLQTFLDARIKTLEIRAELQRGVIGLERE